MAGAPAKCGLSASFGYGYRVASGAGMNAKMARIAASLLSLGLLTAAAPVFAQQPGPSAPAAPRATQAAARHKATRTTSSAEPSYAAVSDPARLAVQSNIVWLGGFDSMSAEEIDRHTVDAIKAFQRRNSGKETGILSDQERAALAEAAARPKAAVNWRLVDDAATGARLGLPEKLVPHASAHRIGSRWTSGQGQIQIETFRLHEASLPALFEEEKKTARRSIGSSVLNPDSFLIVGEQRLKKFIVRAQSSGSEVRGVTILYDQATEGTMAPIAVAVSDTFDGFPDPNALPPAGRKRSVEYGSAIVVTSGGDLVALGQGTAECRSITVPGFGHADRIAEDKTNDLALLRLYGARNLAAAPLAAGGSTTGPLTLVGIGGALGQGVAGGLTRATAQLTAQGLQPAPQLGFSGAAAIDAQGRLAGLVALQAPVTAGAWTVAPLATLVPADSVRAFLASHGITPAAGGAIEQSVVQVICVRK
jgi:hypothetical protein